MQSWADLQRDLLASGYRSAVFLAFACPTGHGRFRAGVAKLGARIPCPKCGLACKTNFMAEGLTLPLVEKSAIEMRPPGLHGLASINGGITRKAFQKSQSKTKLSGFEIQVRRLKLRDDEESQLKSPALRKWTERNRFSSHVPENLLLRWELVVYERDVGRWVRGDSA